MAGRAFAPLQAATAATGAAVAADAADAGVAGSGSRRVVVVVVGWCKGKERRSWPSRRESVRVDSRCAERRLGPSRCRGPWWPAALPWKKVKSHGRLHKVGCRGRRWGEDGRRDGGEEY